MYSSVKTIKKKKKEIIPLSYLKLDDFDELKVLLEFDSVSGDEIKSREYVENKLKELNFTTSIDAYGNLFAVRGVADEYGLLEAHLDKKQINYKSNGSRFNSSNSGRFNSYFGDYSKKSNLNINNIDYGLFKKEANLESSRLSNIHKTKKTITDEEAKSIWEENKEEVKSYFGKEYANFGFNCNHCINKCKSQTFSLCHFFEVNDSLDSKKQFAAYKISEKEKLNTNDTTAIQESFDLTDKTVELIGVKTKNKIVRKKTNEKYIIKMDLINDKITGSGKNRVLGGDDKCGIFAALKVAEMLPNMPMKVLFTVEEEIGCLGAKYFVKNHADWLKDVKYSITIDRKGSNNLLWSQKGIRSCSDEFAGKIIEQGIMTGIPVRIEDGGSADVVYLRDYVPEAINISAGYYNAHRKDEYIIPSELDKIVGWVKNIIENI